MKNTWVIVAVIVVIVVGIFLGRAQLKSMFGMGTPAYPSPAPVAMTASPSAAAMAPSDNIYLIKIGTSNSSHITDFEGKTLYTFDHDTKGVSNCYNGCAAAWPPYISGATAQKTFPTNITVIKRTDGSSQFAWEGMPLYYYASDTKPGDTTGDGVGGIWHIVKP